jgi:tetratricopeptide (TPR) repeat protein
MGFVRQSATAAALLLSVPLSASAGFRCPAKGGGEWREYRSKHFLLQTDAGRAKVELLVNRLESMHALELQALLGEQVEIPGRLRVIAFADPALFTDLAGKYQIAGYYKVGALGEPTIVLPIEGMQAHPQTVAHEVAHHLSTFLFVRQPGWFREGLAEFVQTVADVETHMQPATGSHLVRGARDQRGGVGIVPQSMAGALQEARRVSFKELLEWDGHDDVQGASYHLYGWLLYHWLWNNRSKDFTAFQHRLSNGDDPGIAWQASFPDLDPTNAAAAAKVDDALEGYRRSGRYMSYRVDAKADAAFQETGPIASADVHMLVHEAARSWTEKEQLANLDEALAEDESQPFAIVARAMVDKSSPLARLRKAVTIRPDDWRAWLLLGDALRAEPKKQQEVALRKAVSLNPDSARAQNSLAWLLVEDGRPAEALPIANRALDLAPANPAIIDTLAVVAGRMGKCGEALVLERRALAMVPQSSPNVADFRKRIGEWESGCGASAVQTGGSASPRP